MTRGEAGNLMTEIDSTVSGNSHEVDIRRLSRATKALSSRPSLYQ